MKTSFNIGVGDKDKHIDLTSAYCIGYTGRNIENTKKHIKELADIGISEPPEIPMLYPVRLSSLTRNNAIEVLGNKTSGEAEIVLIFGEENDIYVTIGSDHTDRSLEEVDINLSKQICDKPFAEKAWKLNDILPHWDLLEIHSQVYIDGEWRDYQSDKISTILSYKNIMAYLENKNVSLAGSIFFSGTVPLLNGFLYGTKFKMIFKDPVNKDEITMTYDVNNIERR